MGEFDQVFLVLAPDAQDQLAGERVDHRDADAVQPTGDLVGILIEFSAGVQLRHDDFSRGNAFTLVNVDGNAATVVAYGHRIVGVEDDLDGGGMSSQRFVDGVVDYFIDHMVQTGAVIGIADIHARPLAHGVEALENPDRFRAIFDWRDRFGIGNLLPGRFNHERPSEGVPRYMRYMRLRSLFLA
ncbi:hypothetical protein GGQ85_002125 [Nitrobacter vulgaris]|nr:hypothetical protein [Nitrobacter vulgaris]